MQNIHCIKILCGIRLFSKNIFKGAGRNIGGDNNEAKFKIHRQIPKLVNKFYVVYAPEYQPQNSGNWVIPWSLLLV